MPQQEMLATLSWTNGAQNQVTTLSLSFFFPPKAPPLTLFHRINKGYFINYTPALALFHPLRQPHKKVLWRGFLWSHCPHTCDLA